MVNGTRAEALATDALELGPQDSADDAFAARMRRHQSWYRAQVLGVRCGKGPTGAGRPLGNMLRPEDGAAGRNFLSQQIAQVAKARLLEPSGPLEPYRLVHNLLSSQALCFNLFAPLTRDLELATALLPALVTERVAEVTRVALAWAPSPAGDYLGDRTAFDALFEYRTHAGRRCALGLQVELGDAQPPRVHDGEQYRRWMRACSGTWRPGVEDRVQAPPHNALWRAHLLALALEQQSPALDAARLLVIHHPEDEACARACRGYRLLLEEPCESMSRSTLDVLIARWAARVTQPQHLGWIEALRTRYLHLHLSESPGSGERPLVR